MKTKILEKLTIPEGISCSLEENILTCSKDSSELKRELVLTKITLKIEGSEIVFSCSKGDKNIRKKISSNMAHIKNMFHGLNQDFVYVLEAVNVHFPMTFKTEKEEILINNFLGEKTPRHAKILPNVKVKIEGNKITVNSPDIEAAGQTAANLEKATTVKGRDRRIYQDGVYITEKPKRNKND